MKSGAGRRHVRKHPLEVRRHPGSEADVSEVAKTKDKRHKDGGRLGKHRKPRLLERSPLGHGGRRLLRRRIPEAENKRSDPQDAKGPEYQKGATPSARAERTEPSRHHAAEDDADIRRQLVDRKRHRPRVFVELLQDRRGRRRNERLANAVQDAVCKNHKTDRRNKRRREHAGEEQRRTDDNHPLATEEVGRKPAERNGNRVCQEEYAGNNAHLHVRHAEVKPNLR